MSDVAGAAHVLESFLRDGLGLAGEVPLHEPSFEGREWEYVKDCLDTGWVSTAGSYVGRIEEMIAAACGTRHAVAVVNGTAGLHVLLSAMGVRPGDLVVCPALTFIATANAVSYCGAAPLFADVEKASCGLDADKLACFLEQDCERTASGLIHRKDGRRIAGILPVHIFGHPTDMARLQEIARTHGLFIVEDAAEALGSRYHGRKCGSLSIAGVVSFNGNKTVTTGGGGVIVTDDEELATRLKHLTTTARIKDRWWFDHDAVGFNYRMPNINAALGCAQIENLDEFVARKRRLADLYKVAFRDVSGVRLQLEPAGCDSNYWLNALLFHDAAERDRFLTLTNDARIQTRPCWRLLPDTAAYREAPRTGNLGTARAIVDCLVNIPSGPRLLKTAEA